MIRRPPRSTRTDTLFPYTTLFRSLCDLLVFLFVAGFDTSKNMLTLIMNFLIDRPDQYERCAQDHEYCRQVMDETLRFCSPATTPPITTQDLAYRDVPIPAWTPLFFPSSAERRVGKACVSTCRTGRG